MHRFVFFMVVVLQQLSGTGSLLIEKFSNVNLVWQAPVDQTDPVKGYNVYRSQVSGSGYQFLDFTYDVVYTDEKAPSGQTEFYVVTSVDEFNFESDYSNEVKVVIP